MKSAVRSLLPIVVFAVFPLCATNAGEVPVSILSVGGERAWGIAINGQAVGWVLTRPHHNVTISARLGNGGGHAYVDAYLMRAIGPDASSEDEVSHTSFDLVYPHVGGWIPLFANVDLEAGPYWLIVARPRDKPFSSINWVVAQPSAIAASCDVRHLGTKSYTFMSDVAEYIPASKFEARYEPYGFQIELTEARLPNTDECVR